MKIRYFLKDNQGQIKEITSKDAKALITKNHILIAHDRWLKDRNAATEFIVRNGRLTISFEV